MSDETKFKAACVRCSCAIFEGVEHVCNEGEAELTAMMDKATRHVEATEMVIAAARAWKLKEPWPYLNHYDLATALDALEKLEHHENCDVLDPQIKGKPCNCKVRAT